MIIFYISHILKHSDVKNGLLVESNFGNSSDHIDLGYPITTVLGRQLHVDPNFFGVKVFIYLFYLRNEIFVFRLPFG